MYGQGAEMREQSVTCWTSAGNERTCWVPAFSAALCSRTSAGDCKCSGGIGGVPNEV